MLLVKYAGHYRTLDSDQTAVGHGDSRRNTQRLPSEASFTEKITGAENRDDGFLTLLGGNR